MVQIDIQYTGQKHCDLVHGPSKSKIGTDAPKDNNGKGELFSPTDLLAAALGSCMLTVMGIFADKEGINIDNSKATVIKDMQAQPRKVKSLSVNIHLPTQLSVEQRNRLENVAMNCPVKLSLHPDVQIPVQFLYDI